MKPPRSILDPAFAYVPASHTDIRIRFAAERKRIEEERLRTVINVRLIQRKEKK